MARSSVLIFNRIYEHALHVGVVVSELHRVLTNAGVIYLGLGNRVGGIEPD